MKKLLFLALCGLLLSSAVHAQDIITKKDGSELEVKVLEITDTQVKYKKHSNPEGPTYTVSKSQVFMIKYENGDKDMFGETAPVKQTVVTPKVSEARTQYDDALQNQRPANTGRNFDFGIKTSFHVGFIFPYYDEDYYSDEVLAGPAFEIGGFFNAHLFKNQRNGFKGYIGVGTTYQYQYLYSDYDADMSSNRINADVYFGVRMVPKKVGFNAKLGLRSSILLNADLVGDSYYYDNRKIDVTGRCNSVQFGVIGAAGLAIGQHFDLNFEFSFLSNYYKYDLINGSSPYFSFGVGFAYRF